MSDIVMPKLSDSMESGTILSWLAASGDEVQVGDELLEIETDKSTVTYIAELDGVIEILVKEGSTVAVGEAIATIGTAATETQPLSPDRTPERVTTPDTPASSPAGAPAGGRSRPVNGDGRPGVLATPLARRIAAAHDVSLGGIQGSGPLGRITRADVLGHAGLAPADAPSLPTIRRAPAPPPAAVAPGTHRRPLSRLQQLIARRMAEAKATVPHFQVQTEAAMDSAIALRAQLKAVAGDGDPVPTFTDLIIKAAALALREHPLANGSYRDDAFVLHDAINVGMAVAADDALVVPTVFDAAGKSLGQIARETRALAARVRNGESTPAELDGGTFTVSNLGMFGMTAISPVINPPQAAILGVGAMRDTLARVDAQIVDRVLLTLTLSCDHRILYGADAARFLARIRELLETPLTLVLGSGQR
jgi:pyruvate dehydrogenase E2 component (dihydrolipoamide acetyltransferase)